MTFLFQLKPKEKLFLVSLLIALVPFLYFVYVAVVLKLTLLLAVVRVAEIFTKTKYTRELAAYLTVLYFSAILALGVHYFNII